MRNLLRLGSSSLSTKSRERKGLEMMLRLPDNRIAAIALISISGALVACTSGPSSSATDDRAINHVSSVSLDERSWTQRIDETRCLKVDDETISLYFTDRETDVSGRVIFQVLIERGVVLQVTADRIESVTYMSETIATSLGVANDILDQFSRLTRPTLKQSGNTFRIWGEGLEDAPPNKVVSFDATFACDEISDAP